MHVVLNLNGVGMGGWARAVAQKRRLASRVYKKGYSYEVALAKGQNNVYSALLTELGFECKMVSTNPNTGRRIEGWFKQC